MKAYPHPVRGAGVIGHVTDNPDTLMLKPYSLCEKCHMEVPE